MADPDITDEELEEIIQTQNPLALSAADRKVSDANLLHARLQVPGYSLPTDPLPDGTVEDKKITTAAEALDDGGYRETEPGSKFWVNSLGDTVDLRPGPEAGPQVVNLGGGKVISLIADKEEPGGYWTDVRSTSQVLWHACR